MTDAAMWNELGEVYEGEVLPVFAALGMAAEARAYRDTAIDRFSNPFLDHRLSDIYVNHEAKKQRRFGGLIALAEASGLHARQPRLSAALAMNGRIDATFCG
jgi:tagaturonate reductase